MVPLLVRRSLLPCIYTAVLLLPEVCKVPVLEMTPFEPRIEAARALLPLVVTVPLLMMLLLACPVLVWPQAAVMP